MRAVKTPEEIRIMQELADITSEGHCFVMRNISECQTEHQVQVLFSAYIGSKGCSRQAYGAICGSGANAAILHYKQNNCTLRQGDMLLCDMGAFGNNYCSDVTTTFPISGKFLQKQKEIYEIVLEAEINAINESYEGSIPQVVQKNAFVTLLEGLRKVGILKTTDIQAAYDLVILFLLTRTFTDISCLIHWGTILE